MIIEISESIGENIRTIRLFRNLTLVQLAEMSGLNAATILKYEQGQRNPKDYNLVKIGAALGVDYLILKGYEAKKVSKVNIKEWKKNKVGIIDDIGANIKTVRLYRGLTQKELGEKMGVTDACIRAYENGRRTPKEVTLKRIAAGLGVDYHILKGCREVKITEAEI